MLAPNGNLASAFAKPQPDATLVKAIARAYRWTTLLEQGAYASLQDLAAAKRISPTYISRLLRLTLLSPEMVERVLDGRDVPSRGLEVVADLWSEQR